MKCEKSVDPTGHFASLVPDGQEWFSPKEAGSIIGRSDQFVRDSFNNGQNHGAYLQRHCAERRGEEILSARPPRRNNNVSARIGKLHARIVHGKLGVHSRTPFRLPASASRKGHSRQALFQKTPLLTALLRRRVRRRRGAKRALRRSLPNNRPRPPTRRAFAFGAIALTIGRRFVDWVHNL